MEENRLAVKPEKSKKQKPNKSSSVTIKQIVLVIIIVVTFFFLSKSSADIKSDFSRLMSWEVNKDDVLGVFNEWKAYFDSAESAWAVSDFAITNSTDESITSEISETSQENSDTTKNAEESSGTGGKDLEVFEAEKNTSFAPFVVTGSFLNPVDSDNYTSYFGYRINPISGEFAFHTGLDIGADMGENIRAAFNGTVEKTGEDNQAGKYIFLRHADGFETFYCHCSEILAETGAVIRQGETIAKVGSTGSSTGPHLHFEIRKNNIRLNPLQLFEK